MGFRVELSAQAQRDIAAIYDWLLSQQAGDAGERWFIALRTAIASLLNLPSRCPLAPENPDSPVELRQLPTVESLTCIASFLLLKAKPCAYSTSGMAGAGPFAAASEQSVNNLLPNTG